MISTHRFFLSSIIIAQHYIAQHYIPQSAAQPRQKDQDLKPPAGFRLPVGKDKIGCGAPRLLEL